MSMYHSPVTLAEWEREAQRLSQAAQCARQEGQRIAREEYQAYQARQLAWERMNKTYWKLPDAELERLLRQPARTTWHGGSQTFASHNGLVQSGDQLYPQSHRTLIVNFAGKEMDVLQGGTPFLEVFPSQESPIITVLRQHLEAKYELARRLGVDCCSLDAVLPVEVEWAAVEE